MSRRPRSRTAVALVLGGLATFWTALFVAAHVNPGYSERRDYISSLAAHGAEHAWLGMLAIAALGIAGIGVALLVRPLTRWGAAAFLVAGLAYVVAGVARIDCPDGAARCGLGGRFDIHGGPTITHWTAAVVANVLVLAGLVLVGERLARGGRRLAASGTFVAAGVTLVALVATGGQTPGQVQRGWILVMTAWLAAATWALEASSRAGG
jgi:Protein of unknown function (DUF998)